MKSTGADVSLYVSLPHRVCVGDALETRRGRRYAVTFVRELAPGRYHVRAIVMSDDSTQAVRFTHRIRWGTAKGGSGRATMRGSHLK